MIDPLFVAAGAFLTIILIGTLLVAANDWLESRWSSASIRSSGRIRRPRLGPSCEIRYVAVPRVAPSRGAKVARANRGVVVRSVEHRGDWF